MFSIIKSVLKTKLTSEIAISRTVILSRPATRREIRFYISCVECVESPFYIHTGLLYIVFISLGLKQIISYHKLESSRRHLINVSSLNKIVKLRLRSGPRSGSLRLTQALSGSLRLLLCDFDSET